MDWGRYPQMTWGPTPSPVSLSSGDRISWSWSWCCGAGYQTSTEISGQGHMLPERRDSCKEYSPRNKEEVAELWLELPTETLQDGGGRQGEKWSKLRGFTLWQQESNMNSKLQIMLPSVCKNDQCHLKGYAMIRGGARIHMT